MGFIRENIAKILIFTGVLIVIIIIFALLFGNGGRRKELSYSDIENKMKNVAIKYTQKNKKLLPKKENESNKINLDTLVNAKYINEVTAIENENIKCTGYVRLLYKNKENIYVPYIKCGKYYETSSLAEYIVKNEPIVITSDGLYKSDNKYIYRGENVKNYLQLGDRLYRIMEISDNGELKLISNKKLNQYLVWDDRYNPTKDSTAGINDYSKSRLKDSFDTLIKTNTFNPEDDTYYFSEQEMEKMIPHDICIGKRSSGLGIIDSSYECQVIEKGQKISLMTVSDYAKASVDPNCRTIFDKSCMNYNYLSQLSETFRTVTATTDNTYQIFYINEGYAQLSRAANSFSSNIVIYIDNLSLYSKGDGSFENPYYVR